MNTRASHIDFLRFIGIIGVIAIHVLYVNFSSPIEGILWNYLHFVVALLVFCSGYVLALKTTTLNTPRAVLQWYKKRVVRLILPYYVYVVFHIGLINLIPSLFSGFGMNGSKESFIGAMLFLDRVNTTWLPLLFIQLTLLFPLLIYLINTKKLWLYILFAGIITSITSIKPFPFSYYWYMWISWSLIVLLGIYVCKKDKDSKNTVYVWYGLFSLLGFAVCNAVWVHFGKTTNIMGNEYPPTFLHLFYGAAAIFVFLFIATMKFLRGDSIQKYYSYISAHSYGLYFIHYIVLDGVVNVRTFFGHYGSIIEFILVLGISFIVLKLINYLTKHVSLYLQ